MAEKKGPEETQAILEKLRQAWGVQDQNYQLMVLYGLNYQMMFQYGKNCLPCWFSVRLNCQLMVEEWFRHGRFHDQVDGFMWAIEPPTPKK